MGAGIVRVFGSHGSPQEGTGGRRGAAATAADCSGGGISSGEGGGSDGDGGGGRPLLLLNTYGVTEACCYQTAAAMATPTLLSCAGPPLAGVMLWVVDPASLKPVPHGCAGEVLLGDGDVMAKGGSGSLMAMSWPLPHTHYTISRVSPLFWLAARRVHTFAAHSSPRPLILSQVVRRWRLGTSAAPT